MGKFIDILRKLGILRFGKTAAVYTNAKDRPIEFQMDGVYDSKKDLISNENKK